MAKQNVQKLQTAFDAGMDAAIDRNANVRYAYQLGQDKGLSALDKVCASGRGAKDLASAVAAKLTRSETLNVDVCDSAEGAEENSN